MFSVHVQRRAAGTMILRLGPMARSSATVGAACIRCSKLSSRSSTVRAMGSCKFSLSSSSGDWPPASRIPNA